MSRARARTARAALLERRRELNQLDLAVGASAAGEGRVLLIEGPAGIGKTALLDTALRRGRKAGMVTLTARGDELGAHFSYGVVRQLLEPPLHAADASARRKLLRGSASAVTAVLELSDEGGPESGPSPNREAGAAFTLMHGLFWLVVGLSAKAPVLIAVDDAHWADGPSLRFLRYLAGRLDGVPVVLLLSTRSGEDGFAPDLMAALTADPGVEVIRPTALSDRAIARLLVAGLGQQADEQFAAAVCAATGGNPFLVHELVGALAADGIRPTAAEATRVQMLGPRTVARATLVRLGRLPVGSVALARSIAVLALDAQLPRARKLAALEEPQALEALDALIAADVVQVGQTLEFAHPIVRAAIYEELPPGERSRWHRQAARLLAAEGAELDAVAGQLLLSEPTGSPEVIAALRDAAAHALSRAAPEDAVAYLSRALREGAEREQQASLSFELGTASKLAAQPAMVEHFTQARRLANEPLLRSSAALELASALAMMGQWDAPGPIIETALDDLGDRSPELSVRLERLRAGNAAFDPRLVAEFERRLPELRQLVAQAGPPARPLALLLAAVLAWRGRGTEEVLALFDRGWDEGRLLASGVDQWTLSQAPAALVMIEQLERAETLVEELLAHGAEIGSLGLYIMGSSYRGWVQARRGNLSGAEGELRAALELAQEQRLQFALPSLLWFAADVIVERPQAADLAAIVTSFQPGSMADTTSGAMLLDVRARARHIAGQTTGAIADLRRAGEIYRALGFRNPGPTCWRSSLALMMAAADRDEARLLASEELQDAAQIGQSRAIGVALGTLGMLEGGASGRERLAQAAKTLEGSPARLEHGRALVELGAALRRDGQRTASRGPLVAGLDIAVAGGADRLVERARAELAASGARPRRLRVSGRDALTPSELRVARLAAQGRTNHEVAQALFVTPKTVDTHLTHAYSKLGISSRRDLATALETDASSTSNANPPKCTDSRPGPGR